MKRLIYCLLLLSSFSTLSAQISENFDDGNLAFWEGDIDDFIVNTNGKLQLSAASAGESFIYGPTAFFDSLVWSLDVELNFSPSGSNKLQIYLAIHDIADPDNNALVLELGESGSDDAINLVRYINGQKTTLASGIMGNVASSFALNFELSRNSLAEWFMFTTDLESNLSEEEFRLLIAEEPLPEMGYFGIRCTYTSSRTEGFIFDNVFLYELVPDIIPPSLLSADAISGNEIVLNFDEEIEVSSAGNLANYSLDPFINVSTAGFGNSENEIRLGLNENLESGTPYTLTINGLSDNSGNIITTIDSEIVYTRSPQPGDLLINEILFDPYSGGEDFVEIINASNDKLRIKDLVISNDDKFEEELVDAIIFLDPGQIVAFSEDVLGTEDIYQVPDEALIVENDLPSFNNADGNISLYIVEDSEYTFIDGFNYEEEYHSSLLRDTEGVSLERISLIADTNDPSNWFSASANTLYATPGYANSVRSSGIDDDENVLELEYQVFSPNNDGDKDILIMNYKLDNPGYVGTIQIYSDRGQLVKTIINNELLGTEGVYIWSGTNQEGRLSPIGMYIVLYEFFNSAGDIKKGKHVCVLGQQLN